MYLHHPSCTTCEISYPPHPLPPHCTQPTVVKCSSLTMFLIYQPEDGQWKGPKYVVVLYVINYTYLYQHIVVLDKYIHSNLVYYKHNGDDEPYDYKCQLASQEGLCSMQQVTTYGNLWRTGYKDHATWAGMNTIVKLWPGIKRTYIGKYCCVNRTICGTDCLQRR